MAEPLDLDGVARILARSADAAELAQVGAELVAEVKRLRDLMVAAYEDGVDLGGLDKAAYRVGKDPLDWAVSKTAIEIRVRGEIVAARAEDPSTYPGYTLDLDDESLSRRIVGGLLDAGWAPPNGRSS